MLKQRMTKGVWVTSKNGDMCAKGFYHITKERLTEDNWFIHLSTKSWFDWNDFMPCYLQACFNAGVQFVTFKAYYSN